MDPFKTFFPQLSDLHGNAVYTRANANVYKSSQPSIGHVQMLNESGKRTQKIYFTYAGMRTNDVFLQCDHSSS